MSGLLRRLLGRGSRGDESISDVIARLHASESRLKLFIEHAPAALAMFDGEMKYIAVSRRWLDYFLIGDRDVTGLCHYDLFPKLADEYKAIHRRCLAGEIIRRDEDLFEMPDGSKMWSRWEVRPWFVTGDRPAGIVLFVEDITPYKRAEQRQRHLAEVLNALREINKLVLEAERPDVLLRQACHVLTTSRGYRSAWACTLKGATLGNLTQSGLGSSFSDFRGFFDRVHQPHCMDLALDSEDVVLIKDTGHECAPCPISRVHGSAMAGLISHGSRRYGALVVSLTPELAADPEERKLFKDVLVDIGFAFHHLEAEQERGAAMKRLRESEERFATTFQVDPTAVSLTSVSSDTFIDVNGAFERLFGYPRDLVIGSNGDRLGLWPPGVRARLLAQYDAEGRVDGAELTAYDARGRELALLVHLTPIALGEQPGVLGSFIDITDRKRRESIIRRALDEKDTLVKELYHRTKNNMAIIVAMLVLRSTERPDLPLDLFVDEMTRKIGAMSFAHEELYRSKDLSSIDLGRYLSELSRMTLEKLGVENRITLSSELSSVQVSLDTALPLGLVVEELLANAIAHAFPGGRMGSIGLGLSTSGDDGVILTFADDGVGMAQDVPRSFGLNTAYAILEEQLLGTMTMAQEGGTRYTLSFRRDLHGKRI